MSSLYNDYGVNPMLKSFEQFRNSYRGNPQQQVQQLLNSGRMSQAEFNRIQEQARQFMQFIGR